MEPFALTLYRLFLNGSSVEQLSKELGIPRERVEQRLRAAADHLQKRTLKMAA